MSTINLSINGPSIQSSYRSVVNSPLPSGSAASSPTYAQWAVFSVSAPLVSAFQSDGAGKESVLKVQETGEGDLENLIEEFSEGRIQFAFVKVKDSNSGLPKYVLIGWCGEGVPERTKGYFTSHLAAVSKVLHGYHVQITARSDRDLTPESIVQKVADASGAKYSAGSAPSPSSSRPTPPVASKPAFMPTRSGASAGFNPLANSRSRGNVQDGAVDEDGWGADAPPVTRSQLEKVEPAYKPIKVNMAELTKQKQEAPRFHNGNARQEVRDDVVKGGYQPVGKVDIAALRSQAQKEKDDRPSIVKGAYEPVGMVDIAAIRARAQKPSDEGAQHVSSVATGASYTISGSEEPNSLADRTSAFSQSERLTSLPKPKVANRFGSSANNFTGTKAPTPGVFGLQSAPAISKAAPIGAASRTFADEGGKTPAQIWEEKKGRQRGLSGAAAGAAMSPGLTSPSASQSSGGGEWKSGYSGKSWAPVPTTATGRSGTGSISHQRTGNEQDQEAAPSSPQGGISALRDRFKEAAPMGEPSESIHRNIPSPPRVQRSPTPPTPEARDFSPGRVAMPVGHGVAPQIVAPEERFAPPPMPTQSISQNVPDEEELTEEPVGHDPARGAGEAVAEASFGGQSSINASSFSGQRAVILYDYEKAEDNELELVEGEYVTNIEMVDDDWWMGTNSRGASGLFPSNYVELVEGEEHPEAVPAARDPSPAPRPAASAGPTATALYDYEAAEDNELSFEEGAKITNLSYPDEDWWHGTYKGQTGLFPSNYVELDQ